MFFDKRGNNKIPPHPYKVPYIHPRNYYQAEQVDAKTGSSQSMEKACISQTTENSLEPHENDPLPLAG